MSEELCRHWMVPAWCAECRAERVPRCRRCNHELTDMMSVEVGVGPMCCLEDERALWFVFDRWVSEAGWRQLGPVPALSAQSWADALRRLDGLEATYRTGDDGKVHVFTRRRNYPFYVTFGQKYRHEPHHSFPPAHPDGYAVVEAPDEDLARRGAFTLFGEHWAFIHSFDEFWSDPRGGGATTEELYPLGELARFVVSVVSGSVFMGESGDG